MRHGTIDETGAQHGCWEVLKYAEGAHWDVRCVECGYERLISGSKLRGKTPGCRGCLRERDARRRLNHNGSRCGCGELLAVRDWVDDRPTGYRTLCKPCYNEPRRGRADKRGANGYEPTLLADPIVRWLKPYLETGTLEELAKLCGLDKTGFARLAQGKHVRVKLDTVDKILCGLDAPGVLRELYPELYEFTPEQMREAELWATEPCMSA